MTESAGFDVFKKPTSLSEPPVTKSKVEVQPDEKVVFNESKLDEGKASDPKVQSSATSNSSTPSKLNVSTQPLPYAQPSWGGLPDVFYSLEEMKNGVSLRTIPLDHRSFFSFGRFENCNVVMAHPTVSRYHAILQFRATFSSTDEKRGFYLFDLGSTHGTFLNKERLQPKTYVKVQVGHMIKFGSSTRFFLLHGPEDDQDDESQYTYTQLKELRKEQLEKREHDYLKERAKLCGESEEEDETKGIDWGMGEDADEETDLTENPYADTNNEDMYIEDPKKALKMWFEREGHELNYQVDEKSFGTFRCTVELPLENAGGGFAIAEAVVSGKKKEATFQCALEACRILDRAGILKQNTQESRKRKLKNWEEDDFYDSDEDNFFDRTGDLETKRKQRMKQIKKTQPTTETYETLIEKHKNLLKEIEDIERKLHTMLVEASCSREDDDNWDSFTSQKQSGQIIDKLEQKKLKNSLNKLKTEEEKLRKLVNFVKPFELPEVQPPPLISIKKEPEDETSVTVKTEPGVVLSEEKIVDVKPEINIVLKKEETILEDKNVESNSETITKFNETAEKSNHINPPEAKKPPSKPKNNNSDRAKKIAESFSNQYEEDFNNIVWKPPSNQTGDGRTSLNDKLGY